MRGKASKLKQLYGFSEFDYQFADYIKKIIGSLACANKMPRKEFLLEASKKNTKKNKEEPEVISSRSLRITPQEH
ncbi:hypothetical protein V6N13_062449 [Hibiscus sabdariffa]